MKASEAPSRRPKYVQGIDHGIKEMLEMTDDLDGQIGIDEADIIYRGRLNNSTRYDHYIKSPTERKARRKSGRKTVNKLNSRKYQEYQDEKVVADNEVSYRINR